MTTTMSSTASTFHLQHICLTYPDGESTVTALDNVSLDVHAGELVAVVGESGSGKSTLLSVAAGLTTPDSGTVSTNGTTSVVFQSPNLLDALSVREQLLVTDHIAGRRITAARRRRADELLARVGLAGFGARRVAQLSGGQRQRVNIARALMPEPSLLLADEPTSALDQRLSRQVVDLLRDLTDERSLATVLVTHDRTQLDRADRVMQMHDGRLSQQEWQ
ncbi:ABC transporter ATP-binding protein [Corynebacterium sp. AOP40-9SA-29]|uniref:ABC transporter ATP-binding protein n=1 Tax=Corynebacterium sp. AOP40-9SA-29 TaxID=3457677 RepID=UPI004033EE83